MNARHPFYLASSVPLGALPGLQLDKSKEHLLVTGLYLGLPYNALKADGENVFAQALTPDCEANETLNSITSWMRRNGSLDQRMIHGDKKFDYNISFFRFREDELSGLSLVKSFYLEDYIFNHNHPSDASHVDDLMRMLDRDRLADAMLDSLKNDLGLNEREDAPLFWRRDIRQCSHPDYRKQVELSLALAS